MARYRIYSIEFKSQVVRELLSGEESLHGLSKRHRISRNLIRLWAKKYEAGEFNEDAIVTSTLKESEARIAALERKVGQLIMENDLLKKSLPRAASPSAAISSVISGPLAFPAHKDVGS